MWSWCQTRQSRNGQVRTQGTSQIDCPGCLKGHHVCDWNSTHSKLHIAPGFTNGIPATTTTHRIMIRTGSVMRRTFIDLTHHHGLEPGSGRIIGLRKWWWVIGCGWLVRQPQSQCPGRVNPVIGRFAINKTETTISIELTFGQFLIVTHIPNPMTVIKLIRFG